MRPPIYTLVTTLMLLVIPTSWAIHIMNAAGVTAAFIACIAVIVLSWLMTLLGFKFESKKSKKFLATILSEEEARLS